VCKKEKRLCLLLLLRQFRVQNFRGTLFASTPLQKLSSFCFYYLLLFRKKSRIRLYSSTCSKKKEQYINIDLLLCSGGQRRRGKYLSSVRQILLTKALRWSLVSLFIILNCIASIYGEFQGILPQDCDFEPLPDTFNSLSYLDFHHEFHIHGLYYTDFDKIEDSIVFNISSQSLFRIYLAPHEIDADLWLYTSTGQGIHNNNNTFEQTNI
jgi:hypothetical protein